MRKKADAFTERERWVNIAFLFYGAGMISKEVFDGLVEKMKYNFLEVDRVE